MSDTKFSETEIETLKTLAKVSKPRSFETEMSISAWQSPQPPPLPLSEKGPGSHLNLQGRSNAIVQVYNAACSSNNSGRTGGSTCGRKTKGDETLPHILGYILGVTHTH